MIKKPSLQDYSLINSAVKKIMVDYKIEDNANAFIFFGLDIILQLQEDEINDSVTDNFFLKKMKKHGGHDRGIDAIYIDESDKIANVHLFNFKYTTKFENTTNFFPSGEIDKILSFLESLMSKDINCKDNTNQTLYEKMKEIWLLFDSQTPEFIIHICGNYYNIFENLERKRFENAIKQKYTNIKIEYYIIPDLIKKITNKGKKVVSAKIKAINKNLFEKSDGNIRALIVNIDTKDLIKIVINDEDLRNKTDLTDYSILKNYNILEDAFNDNVRIYLRQRSRINRNIKETILKEEDNYKFFYYNNGITITCDNFSYPKGQRDPIIDIKNLQVVNGGQTIHAIYDAFFENPEKLEDIDILCRIYETNDSRLSADIAEYTNSQNPVKGRDLRSIDYVQLKLEKELSLSGYYYERKRNQYVDKEKNKRIDAEKVGQVLMAFFNKMPSEAKNKKSLIFSEKYDEVFNDEINSEKVLVAYNLFEKIEEEKTKFKKGIKPSTYEKELYILHASYYILYFIQELSEYYTINDLSLSNIEGLWNLLYKNALKIVKEVIAIEKASAGNRYSHAAFFKSNKPKEHFEKLRNDKNLDYILNTSIIKTKEKQI